jgi:hypothetical protein
MYCLELTVINRVASRHKGVTVLSASKLVHSNVLEVYKNYTGGGGGGVKWKQIHVKEGIL